MTQPRHLGLVVIATGPYLPFAVQLLQDVERLRLTARVTANVFTDRPDDLAAATQGLSRTAVNPLPVPALRWPEASLLRYELMCRRWDDLEGDALIYLDADLRVHEDFSATALGVSGLAAVAHPGYYQRRDRWRRPRGTWETRRASSAFVPTRLRKVYVCGGVWMGERAAVHDLATTLSARVDRDRDRGITAVWHDESHWNWWVAHRAETTILDPSYCHVGDYSHLGHLQPVISAVDKGNDFVREKTAASALRTWGTR